MRSALFFALAILLPALLLPIDLARAEIVYVEDFENDGQPGFDPMFIHDIGPSPYFNVGDPYWTFLEGAPEHGIVLAMAGAQDSIRFALPAGQHVIYAAVDTFGDGGPEPSDAYSIDFIGELGFERVRLARPCEYVTIARDSTQIGPITEIRLRGVEGLFDNITIHVVPEPSLAVVAGGVTVVWCLRAGFRVC